MGKSRSDWLACLTKADSYRFYGQKPTLLLKGLRATEVTLASVLSSQGPKLSDLQAIFFIEPPAKEGRRDSFELSFLDFISLPSLYFESPRWPKKTTLSAGVLDCHCFISERVDWLTPVPSWVTSPPSTLRSQRKFKHTSILCHQSTWVHQTIL